MVDDSERFEFAKWVLERNLGWIAAAEVKIGVIVALDMAMGGTLATAFSAAPTGELSVSACITTITSVACVVLALFFAAMSILPRVNGPASSYIFFAEIAKQTPKDFAQGFRDASTDDVFQDCLDQIHRNAEIANIKFKWVRRSTIASVLAVPIWITALTLLMRV